jgi:hypothetical protein
VSNTLIVGHQVSIGLGQGGELGIYASVDTPE